MTSDIIRLNGNYKNNNILITHFIKECEIKYSDETSFRISEVQVRSLDESLVISNDVKNKYVDECISQITELLKPYSTETDIVLKRCIIRQYVLLSFLLLSVVLSVVSILLNGIIGYYIICFIFFELCLVSLLITNSIIISERKNKQHEQKKRE